MNTERYSEKKKSGGGLGILICLVIAVLSFIALILINNAISRKEERAAVVVAIKDIPEYTVVTEDDATEYFQETKRTESSLFEGSYSSLEELFEDGSIYTTYGMSKNEIVGAGMFVPYSDTVEGFDKPVEMGIRVSSFERAAGGTLRRGDTVDMSAVDDFGNEYTTTVLILKAFDASGQSISVDDQVGVATAFTVLIERDDYASVAEIAALGTFDLIKTNDVQ